MDARARLVSDHGSGYLTGAFEDSLRALGIQPRRPRASSSTFHETLKARLTRLVDRDWKSFALPASRDVGRAVLGSRRASIQDARAHCHGFFTWYNIEHHHSSLGLLTPADVHHGLAEERVAARAAVLARAYAAYPERFPSGAPHPPARPVEVWINPPTTRETEETRRLAAMSLTTCDLGS